MPLFISDLHLSTDRPDLTRAFAEFLAGRGRDTDALYILGDLFESWIGDDDDDPFVAEIIALMAAYPLPGYVMHGNRDFLLGEQFAARTGFALLDDPARLELGGTSALLMHGDSLCTRDTEYMKVREFLRNPAVQADLLAKPLPERRQIAASARGESQSHTRETAADIMDVTPAEVERVMADNGTPLLIHGHTHRPGRHPLPGGERIVLGDWDSLGWYLEAGDDQLELVSFPIAS